jgi:RNA polymerase sigma-70 factor, ECF subfamily
MVMEIELSHYENDAHQKAAFARVWQKERARVWRIVAAISGSADDADDLTQETGVRALEKFGQWRGVVPVGAWLKRVAVSIALRHRERQKPTAILSDWIADEHSLEPENSVMTMDLQARVRRAVDQLPEEQRTVLVLFAWEGMRYREIADALDVPLGTVMSRLHTARQRLRRELGDETNVV